MNITTFKKKLSVVGRVKLSKYNNLYFSDLLRQGIITCTKLEVEDESAFPLVWEGEGNKGIIHKDYLSKECSRENRVWSTYSDLTYITIYLSKGVLILDVTVCNGDSYYGDFESVRFNATFKVLKDEAIFVEASKDVVSEYLYLKAEGIREKQIEEEEKAKILFIQKELLKGVTL